MCRVRSPNGPFGKRSLHIFVGVTDHLENGPHSLLAQNKKKVTGTFIDYPWKKVTVPFLFLHIFEEFDALFDGRMRAEESVHLPFYILQGIYDVKVGCCLIGHFQWFFIRR